MRHKIEGSEATLLQSAMREITILREQMQKLNTRAMRLNAAVVDAAGKALDMEIPPEAQIGIDGEVVVVTVPDTSAE